MSQLLWSLIFEKRSAAGGRLANVYFLERYTDLKALLTTVAQVEGTVEGVNVFFVVDQGHFMDLFSRLFPNDVIMPMRQINIRPPETTDPAEQRRNVRSVAAWRRCYERVFSSLPTSVDAYFTSLRGRLNLMMIAHVMIGHGHRTFYAGRDIQRKKATYDKRLTTISQIDLDGRSPYLLDLSKAAGLTLAEDPETVKRPVQQYISVDPGTWPRGHFLPDGDWPELIRKYPLELDVEVGPEAVLYIEFPLYRIKGFDRAQTRENILNVLRSVIDRGYIVHIKPHPMDPGCLMIDDTPLQSSPSVRILPAEIPVEYFIYRYPRVLNFGTSTIVLKIPGQKILLRDLLVLKDYEGVKRIGSFDRILGRIDDIDERLTPDTSAAAIAGWPDPRA